VAIEQVVRVIEHDLRARAVAQARAL